MEFIYIVLIINNRYVRWEEIGEECSIKDIYFLLREKYKIEKCIIEIDELVINRPSNDKLKHFCLKKKDLTLKIMTKNQNYVLSKNIF
jgi:hypothetical protein|uniref:Ubiquitin-like domain-containing protein n=1 Tax=viral metagenome TaxID=1070528 RepID=A0A6C0CWE4_9ZZZZ